MNRGGIETWIMNVLRRMDTSAVQFDFLVETTKPAAYDAEILAAGGVIHQSPPLRRRGRAALRLGQILRQYGPYDVVHAHGRHNMGVWVTVAAALGVPVRIGHVHNVTDSHNEDPVRRAYKRATKALLRRNATWVLGCSQAAVDSLYGPGAGGAHDNIAVLPYGIDLGRFTRQGSRAEVAAELDIPPGAKIAGHVGRLVWEKNHGFLLEVFAELHRRDPAWLLLLVGDGPLRGAIEQKAAVLGIAQQVRFTGVRADVPRLMSAMDVFVFPSKIEGFGLVLVEAQALGLACVLGEHLPAEVDLDGADGDLIHRLPLNAGAAAWADAAARAVEQVAGPLERAERVAAAHARVAASPFHIDRSVELLLGTYYNFAHAP
jgi:glycosyltransferase involved in cell wall biosynthesis